MGRGARYRLVLGATAVMAAAVAGCGSGGSGGTAPRASGSATPTAATAARSSPTSDPVAAKLRAKDYVLPDSAAPIGFKAGPSEPDSPDTAEDRKIDAELGRCMGVGFGDDPINEADGSDFDNEATSTSVSSSAEIYRADQVSSDVRLLRSRANQEKLGRCLVEAFRKYKSAPDEDGVVVHIEEITPFDVSYLTHGVAGLRMRMTGQAGQVQKTSADGSGPAIVPAAARAYAPGITLYGDMIFLGTGRVESTLMVMQLQVPPNEALERGLALQANARLDRQ